MKNLTKSIWRVLIWYRDRPMLRLFLVLFITIALWLLWSDEAEKISDKVSKIIATPILVGMFEYMTMNVVFVREFYPLDLFADDIFPDRNSFGYKALYIGYYIAFWLLALYALLAWG